MDPRAPIAVTASTLILGGMALGVWHVSTLEAAEVETEVPRTTLAERATAPEATVRTARLGEATLGLGDVAVFEVCAEGGWDEARWAGRVEWLVWNPATEALLSRQPSTRELLERAEGDAEEGCLVVARGQVPEAGAYALEAVWPEAGLDEGIARVPLRVRMLARPPLGKSARIALALAVIGALGLLVAGGWGRAHPVESVPPSPTAPSTLLRLGAGLGALLATSVLLATVSLRGAAASLLGGLAFAGVEVLAAVGLVPGEGADRARVLGLGPPRQGWLRLVAVAALVAAGLVVTAEAAVAWVPSTGVSPIETFLARPSGAVSFALLAVAVPLAEELFFRGFVYGTARRFGGTVAFVLAAGLFIAAHAPQTWGSWGGLVAVSVTGVTLTGLRAWTGSILPGALAHLAYNVVLAASPLL